MTQKRRSKCLACQEDAKRESLVTPITRAYAYQLLRDTCTHTEDERKNGVTEGAI